MLNREAYHAHLDEALKGAVIERVRPGGPAGDLTVLDLDKGRTFICGRLYAEYQRVQNELAEEQNDF